MRERIPQAQSEDSEESPTDAELRDAFADQLILVEIGRDLIAEKDPDLLLGRILDACRAITGADAGSIFLCEAGERGPLLRFKHAHTFSRPSTLEEFAIPRDERSIAGYVSLSGEVLNIADAYALPADRPYRFNAGYDAASGYRTKSMLVAPMRGRRGDIIGVIQLINSKETAEAQTRCRGRDIADSVRLETPEDFERKVVPFARRYEALILAVANQAAIALENARMVRSIEEQFASFVRASIAAIESRDPATSGHSERVARLATALMRAVDAEREGRYAACSFGKEELLELEYAGLLHDFGKVYLDPRIFAKAKKLFDRDFDCLLWRLKYLGVRTELSFTRREAAALEQGRPLEAANAREKAAEAVRRLIEALDLVRALNEPREMNTDPSATIERLLALAPLPESAADIDGTPLPLLTEEERRNFAILRGTLNDEERRAIQDHVRYTSLFVERIPWPPELAGIPEFCAKHHELLDGSGYPEGLKADRIPLQARMLTIADIYDALAARDRPYKKALPFDTVKRILMEEADCGRLDGELVRLFYAHECWRAAGAWRDG